MKVPKQIQYWRDGEKITEVIEPRKPESHENLMVRDKSFKINLSLIKKLKNRKLLKALYWKDFSDGKTKNSKRPFKVQPTSRVRGYRVDKLGLQEPIFVRKYTTAVLVYCAGVYKSPGKFSGHGGRIEAVR